MRRQKEQVFNGREGQDSAGWDALSRGDYQSLPLGRHFTEHLLSLAKDATVKGEGGAYYSKKWKA